MKKELFRVEQVASKVGCSVETLNNWYRFKRQNPNDKFAKMLPMYKQKSGTAPRFWTETDIKRLIKFKESIPQGRNGVMGSVTQKYVKKENEDGTKKD